MTFPIQMTWDAVAALPNAADSFYWSESLIDPDEEGFRSLAEYAACYSTAYHSSERLRGYLYDLGYSADEEGVYVRDENALRVAHAMFNTIVHEYDLIGEATQPTWTMFKLGGDDDVDYCGGQPSCLTELLLSAVKED